MVINNKFVLKTTPYIACAEVSLWLRGGEPFFQRYFIAGFMIHVTHVTRSLAASTTVGDDLM